MKYFFAAPKLGAVFATKPRFGHLKFESTGQALGTIPFIILWL